MKASTATLALSALVGSSYAKPMNMDAVNGMESTNNMMSKDVNMDKTVIARANSVINMGLEQHMGTMLPAGEAITVKPTLSLARRQANAVLGGLEGILNDLQVSQREIDALIGSGSGSVDVQRLKGLLSGVQGTLGGLTGVVNPGTRGFSLELADV
ncbi:hypothetical protein BN1723_016691, partial [Verticillium longisporum]